MTVLILAGITAAALIFSLVKSPKRTGKSLKYAIRLGRGMLPEVLGILLLVSLLLSVLDKEIISATLGNANKLFSTAMGALIGSVTIIPGVIAFPLSRELMAAGAGSMALAAFITTLTMVGLATSPLEKRYFGTKFTVYRNSLSFIMAIFIALVMGVLL